MMVRLAAQLVHPFVRATFVRQSLTGHRPDRCICGHPSSRYGLNLAESVRSNRNRRYGMKIASEDSFGSQFRWPIAQCRGDRLGRRRPAKYLDFAEPHRPFRLPSPTIDEEELFITMQGFRLNETQRKRFSDALVRVGDDEEILCELAAIAYEDGQPLLQQLDQAISHQDMEQASRSGHSLKGTLSGFETGHPTTLLQPIIDAARRDDPNEASVLFTKAKPQLHSLLKEIHGISG
ncbi:hypothetical protein Pan14r_12350 [Crateriforma conspicua]|uniref:HPt domain-containing protein n=2 Tax=Crateriforma conspicua TaxID=2527996 RepID=A0A5C5Y2Q0_9PLAN|nr:hypothetical protein Pan14r_12350 [Crateriforma conspicua]